MIAVTVKFFPAIALLFFGIASAACSSGTSEWKGTLTGEYKLTLPGKGAETPLDTGKAVLTFTSKKDKEGFDENWLLLGPETPLPNCQMLFYPGSAKRDDSRGVRTALVYKGNFERQVTRDCEVRGDKSDAPARVTDFWAAEITIEEDGKLYGNIIYELRNGERRAVEIKGSK